MNLFHKLADGLKLFGDIQAAAITISAGQTPDLTNFGHDLLSIATDDLGLHVPAKVTPERTANFLVALEGVAVAFAAFFQPAEAPQA